MKWSKTLAPVELFIIRSKKQDLDVADNHKS